MRKLLWVGVVALISTSLWHSELFGSTTGGVADKKSQPNSPKSENNISKQQKLIPDENIENFIVQNLNLSSFRNSFGPRRLPGMRRFSGFGIKPTKISDGLIVFDTSDWKYTIKILRKGDENGDGIEDLVITFIDSAKHGTYHTSNNYVLSRFSEKGDLVAIAFEPHKRLDN